MIEAQKLAWFLERSIKTLNLRDPLDLRFEANRYGPYAHRLVHLLEALDGSYVHCEKRIKDAQPLDTIWFEDKKRETVSAYLRSSEAREFLPAVEAADRLIDGFQSPIGLEALATVDWLVHRQGADATLTGIRQGIANWPSGPQAAQRKANLFSDRLIRLALERLRQLGDGNERS